LPILRNKNKWICRNRKIKGGDKIKKEEKEFIDATLSALKGLKKDFDKASDVIHGNNVLMNVVPFLAIGMKNLQEIIEEYIKIFEKFKKKG